MGTTGIWAIAGNILVGVAFEPTSIMVKLAYALFGAAAGTIVGQTIEAEAVNVKKQFDLPLCFLDEFSRNLTPGNCVLFHLIDIFSLLMYVLY
jgi:hypothetical protein